MFRSKRNRMGSSIVHRIMMAVVFTASLAITPAAPALAGTEIYSGAPINLDLAEAELKDVLEIFSVITEFVFAVDPQTAESGALDQLVTVVYEDTPWDRAMDEILSSAGLDWTLEGKVLWIHLPAAAPAGDRNFTGDEITLRLKDAELAVVVDNMSRVTGLMIESDSEIEGTVTVNLRGLPWDQILDLVLRISGFECAQEGDVLTVFKTTDSKGMQLIPTSNT